MFYILNGFSMRPYLEVYHKSFQSSTGMNSLLGVVVKAGRLIYVSFCRNFSFKRNGWPGPCDQSTMATTLRQRPLVCVRCTVVHNKFSAVERHIMESTIPCTMLLIVSCKLQHKMSTSLDNWGYVTIHLHPSCNDPPP